MSSSGEYEVRLSSVATRQLRRLNPAQRERVNIQLKRQASRSGLSSGSRGGKSLKRIRGRQGNFYRLRIGELRIVFDLIHEDNVLLVFGIVHRRDLERWLRGR